MPSVDSALAAWLKQNSLFSTLLSGGFAWGNDRTGEVEYQSAIDAKADADAENARHSEILAGPNVKDVALVPGRRRDLLGKCISVVYDRLGYEGGARSAFVIGVSENADNGTTALTIIRNLDPYAGFSLALDFKAGDYKSGAVRSPLVTALPGYSYTRSGAKRELNALLGLDRVDDFAANVPGIVPGIGYWSRVALTNGILHSQAFDNAVWAKLGGTIVANNATDPGGTVTADTFTRSAINEPHYVGDNAAASYTNGTTYTFSVFAKMGTNRFLQLYIGGTAFPFGGGIYANFDIQDGVVGTVNGATATIISCGNGWFRCVLTATATVTSTNYSYVFLVDSLTAAVTTTGVGNSNTVQLWQFQGINGSYPDGGPIIETAGAAATIGADVLKATEFSLPPVDCLILASMTNGGVDNSMFYLQEDGSNYIAVRGYGDLLIVDAGVTSLYSAPTPYPVAWAAFKVAIIYRGGKITFIRRVAGSTVTQAETGAIAWPFTTGSVVKAYIGYNQDAPGQQNGAPLARLLVKQATVTNAEAIALLEAM